MSSIIHGKNLVVSINGTPVAAAKSCDIIQNTEMIETCSTDDGGYRSFYPGRSDWSVNVGFFVTSITPPARGTAVTLSLNGDVLGSAYVSQWKITGVVGHLSQGALVFQGTGPMSGVSPVSTYDV